ncbi:MAG: ComF family protein [Campylobacterales bacterium]|nr:ComF family protein [Campylobacterales bacterium]
MHCMMCETFSLSHICKNCQINYLSPQIRKQKIYHDIELISFYKYEEIKTLLHTKHTDVGEYIYKLLAENSMALFAQEFQSSEQYDAIGIDDHVRNGYSHTAILTKALHSQHISPLYNMLRAKSHLSYSGKSKYFRQKNPRNFNLRYLPKKQIILVDDIVTTGSTMQEAIRKISHENIAFCLALVDLR